MMYPSPWHIDMRVCIKRKGIKQVWAGAGAKYIHLLEVHRNGVLVACAEAKMKISDQALWECQSPSLCAGQAGQTLQRYYLSCPELLTAWFTWHCMCMCRYFYRYLEKQLHIQQYLHRRTTRSKPQGLSTHNKSLGFKSVCTPKSQQETALMFMTEAGLDHFKHSFEAPQYSTCLLGSGRYVSTIDTNFTFWHVPGETRSDQGIPAVYLPLDVPDKICYIHLKLLLELIISAQHFSEHS